MTKKPRDYDEEYKAYHASPEQKKRRAARNRARRRAIKKYGKSALEGKEVHHTGSHRTGSLDNVPTRVISKSENRKRQPKRS